MKTKTKPLPSQEMLRKLLDYDQDTGLFYWKRRGREHFDTDFNHRMWNGRYAGTEALTSLNPHGYRRGAINPHGRPQDGEGYHQYLAHRVAYKWVTGLEAPEIDHQDGDITNNRFANFRPTTRKGNSQNIRIRTDNKVGYHGVDFRKCKNKWRANITIEGKAIHLGYFKTMGEAVEARKTAEAEHGFHANHGRDNLFDDL